jgi:hypothetical protein
VFNIAVADAPDVTFERAAAFDLALPFLEAAPLGDVLVEVCDLLREAVDIVFGSFG